jgi:hypothetical protein
MGYGEFGGNGSVDWKVDVDDKGKPGKKRASAYGRDDQTPTDFTITIDFDDAAKASVAWTNIRTALAGLGGNAKKLVFKVPVESENGDQIKVAW